MIKKLAALLFFIPSVGLAQTSPNWPLGYQPSMSEWNAEFASKYDVTNSSLLKVTLPSGDILVGNASNLATPAVMSGDATISNAGVLTVGKIGGKSVTLGGALTTSGAFSLTLTTTAATNVTLPISGTLLNDSLTSANFYVGSAGNVATGVAMSGDVALTNAGATTVSKIGGTSISLAGATALGVATTTVGAGTYYAGHGLINIQTFCASGCTATGGTYTATAGTNRVEIEVVAAGGGGGGCAGTSGAQSCVSGSAAGGSYGRALFTSAFSGITMTVGSVGGAGSSAPGNGGTGGTTSAGALISCPGGVGGALGVVSAAAAFSTLALGVVGPSACTFSGQVTGTAISVPGGTSGAGFVAGVAAGAQFPGQSGNTPLGVGVGALFTSNAVTAAGRSGTGYGWGAGGSWNAASQSATTGVAGGPALIIVREYN